MAALWLRHTSIAGALNALILHPMTEQRLAQSILSSQGGGLGISPQEASALMDRLGQAIQTALAQGHEAVLLVTGQLRRHLRQITVRFYPDLPVVSYSEIGTNTAVEVLDTITLDNAVDTVNEPVAT